MANYNQPLTASNIKYLLVLYNICPENSGVRCVRIAETLGITKPSVHAMINTLKNMELVTKDLYGEVAFTKKGLALAERYNGYYDLINKFFGKILPDEKDAHSAACAVMAELSEESLCMFCKRCENSANNI